jgi:hypothetical protein
MAHPISHFCPGVIEKSQTPSPAMLRLILIIGGQAGARLRFSPVTWKIGRPPRTNTVSWQLTWEKATPDRAPERWRSGLPSTASPIAAPVLHRPRRSRHRRAA